MPESELPKLATNRTTFLGDMPIFRVRGRRARSPHFENAAGPPRLPSRSTIAVHRQPLSRASYHALVTYDLAGSPVRHRVLEGPQRKGGPRIVSARPTTGRAAAHHRAGRARCIGTLSPDPRPLEEYAGCLVLGRLRRVLHKNACVWPLNPCPAQQLEAHTWKNVKDTYHAEPAPAFFGTFRIHSLTRSVAHGSPDGGHHASYPQLADEREQHRLP